MMKKLVVGTVAATLALSLAAPAAFAATKAKKMGEDNTAETIASQYEIGQQLSQKDLQAIKKNALVGQTAQPGEMVPAQTDNWSIYGSNRDSTATIEGDVYGNLTVTLGFWNNSVTGNLTTSKVRGSISSMDTSLHFVGYGAIGTSGSYVGKSADWTQGTGYISGVSSTHLGVSQYFGASIAYYDVYPTGHMKYFSGTLTISGHGTLS